MNDTSPHPADPTWTGPGRVRAALFVVIAAIMVALPAVRMLDDGPSRFGWQMFAVSTPVPAFTVVTDDGEVVSIDVEAYTAFVRSDISLVEVLPNHLCRHIRGARHVEVGGDVPATVACR